MPECNTAILPSRRATALIIAVGLVLGFASFTIGSGDAAIWLARATTRFDRFPLGVLLLVMFCLYSGAVMIGIPNAILCISTAAILHAKLKGSNLGFVGAVVLSAVLGFSALLCGGTAAYAMGASVLKEWAERLAAKSPTFVALDEALARDGAKVSALLRTSLPHAMVNFGMSVSRAPFTSFVIGFVGHAPWCILYSWIGCSIDSIRDLNEPAGGSGAEQARAWGGLVALAVTAVVLTFATQRALRKAISEAGAMEKSSAALASTSDAARISPEAGNEGPVGSSVGGLELQDHKDDLTAAEFGQTL
jgi:uncharacterized membrane protein YdjX (TVP38/TMEM64 family)